MKMCSCNELLILKALDFSVRQAQLRFHTIKTELAFFHPHGFFLAFGEADGRISLCLAVGGNVEYLWGISQKDRVVGLGRDVKR